MPQWFIIFQKCHPFGETSKTALQTAIPSDAWLNRGLPGPRQEQCGPLPQLSSGLMDLTGAQDQRFFIWRKFKDFKHSYLDLDGFGCWLWAYKEAV